VSPVEDKKEIAAKKEQIRTAPLSKIKIIRDEEA
jgi:hypothetical protein